LVRSVAEVGELLLLVEDVVTLAVQSPVTRLSPNRHLHDLEHKLSSMPFSDPLSHSSPNLRSTTPFPQPRGVAPREMMYGTPVELSAKVLSPSPVAPWAMASGSKPFLPLVG